MRDTDFLFRARKNHCPGILFNQGGYPFATEHEGTYYYTMQTPGCDSIILYTSPDIESLTSARQKIVFTYADLNMHNFYSPELHRINGNGTSISRPTTATPTTISCSCLKTLPRIRCRGNGLPMALSSQTTNGISESTPHRSPSAKNSSSYGRDGRNGAWKARPNAFS